MHNGDDNRSRSLNAKVNSIGKSRHRRTSSVVAAMNDGIRQGVLDYTLECSHRFGEKFVPETCALLLVPRCRRSEVSSRLFRESDCVSHSFFLMSAITSSAGRLK